MVVAATEDPELIQYAKSKGAKGINIAVLLYGKRSCDETRRKDSRELFTAGTGCFGPVRLKQCG
jgi:uncharacterized NAD-dependent epimerase/dehydratase family protein